MSLFLTFSRSLPRLVVQEKHNKEMEEHPAFIGNALIEKENKVSLFRENTHKRTRFGGASRALALLSFKPWLIFPRWPLFLLISTTPPLVCGGFRAGNGTFHRHSLSFYLSLSRALRGCSSLGQLFVCEQ